MAEVKMQSAQIVADGRRLVAVDVHGHVWEAERNHTGQPFVWRRVVGPEETECLPQRD